MDLIVSREKHSDKGQHRTGTMGWRPLCTSRARFKLNVGIIAFNKVIILIILIHGCLLAHVTLTRCRLLGGGSACRRFWFLALIRVAKQSALQLLCGSSRLIRV